MPSRQLRAVESLQEVDQRLEENPNQTPLHSLQLRSLFIACPKQRQNTMLMLMQKCSLEALKHLADATRET